MIGVLPSAASKSLHTVVALHSIPEEIPEQISEFPHSSPLHLQLLVHHPLVGLIASS